MFGLDKPLGLTSLQCLDALRAADRSLRDEHLGHAGRLDPMAEGLLCVLVGDETRHVHAHRAADKTYELDVLFGLGTDSFDSLGLVTTVAANTSPCDRDLADACARWTGPIAQRVPPYSQARVGGRSLLAWGAAGVTMERPAIARVVSAITLIGRAEVDGGYVAYEAERRISLVRGSFRQGDIAARWRDFADAIGGAAFTVASLRVDCSSGTYMRSLAHDIGAALDTPATAWRIRRVRVGALTLDGARRLP